MSNFIGKPLDFSMIFHSLYMYSWHLCREVYSFVFPFICSSVRMFVCSYVRLFVRTSVTFVEFTSKFCIKVSQVVYISATTYQKTFIFEPYLPWRVGIHSMARTPGSMPWGGARGQKLGHLKNTFSKFCY